MVTGVQRVDREGGKAGGWANLLTIDICDTCWQQLALLDLERLITGGGVKRNAMPQLNEENKS